jgi:hypothetical protein
MEDVACGKMDAEYISFKRAAEIAGYRNPSALHAAARAGRLKSTTFGPHARVTTRAWLDDYLSSLRLGDYKRGEVRENE